MFKSTIVPIHQSMTKDPHIPLYYRGISLLSCVCKGYSNILSKKLFCIVIVNKRLREWSFNTDGEVEKIWLEI